MRGIHENNRITAIETKKIKPSTTRILLWEKLKKWSEEDQNVPEEYRTHIRRMHQSFEIANASVPKKWMMIAKGLVKDFQGIKSGIYNINFRENLF